jgi:hypothetical protein
VLAKAGAETYRILLTAIGGGCPPRARSLAVERPFDVDRSKVRKRGALDCDVFYLDHGKGPATAMAQHERLQQAREKATAVRSDQRMIF